MLDLARTFLQSVERSPDALAIVDGPTRLTYAQWHAVIARVAAGLDALGLRREDRILSVLQNRHEAASLHWTCQFLGIVVVPLNWRAKPEEIDYCVTDAEVKAVFFEQASAEACAGSVAARDLPRIAVGVDAAFDGAIVWDDLIAAPASV